jgi:hypothetical protein
MNLASLRGLDRWLIPYLLHASARRQPRPGERVCLLLCVADHFEPRVGSVSPVQAQQRVEDWCRLYPQRFGSFRDSDGRPPRHTFFYPLEDYEPEYLGLLAGLCRRGFGEVEVHLHHDGDNAADLSARLLWYKDLLAHEHGLLARHRQTGEIAYGFIHGNWALDNSRPDGRLCGVNGELEVLRQTGCYADFTLPSAPNATQTRKINSIYYAVGDPRRCKAHDHGIDVGRGPAPERALLLIQGPLLLNWQRRKWGILPHVENACLQANQAPDATRLGLWLRARIQVPTRPDWFFVKLHTHGAPERNAGMLLGKPMVHFHRLLAERARQDPAFTYHYVSAREMCNLVRAAEAGWTGCVAAARDFEFLWNGAPAACGLAVDGDAASGWHEEKIHGF